MSIMLLLAFAALIGMGASLLSVIRAREQIEQQSNRLRSVIGPHRPSWSEVVPTVGIGRTLQQQSLGAIIRSLLRYDPKRRTYYPLSLPIVCILASLLGLAFGFAGSRFIDVIGWLLGPLAGVWFIRAFHGWAEDRVQRSLYIQFPDALATIVRTVRVGLPVLEAIRIVARESAQPTSREFNFIVEQTNIGVPLDEALRDMGGRNGLPEYRFFATALSLQSQTGGGLSETLENLAETIRKRVEIRLRGHALAAEARMSAYILAALPIVTGALLSVINPQYVGVLFTDPSGRNLLFAGIGMLTMGGLTMRTIIRRSLS